MAHFYFFNFTPLYRLDRFNAVQEHVTPAFLRTFSENTTVILIFDTDTDNSAILAENISLLAKSNRVKAVWCVIQVQNLEDEIMRSTDVSDIKELVGSKSNKDYKHDFISEKHLFEKLASHHFDFAKIWITIPNGAFAQFSNDGKRIKLK